MLTKYLIILLTPLATVYLVILYKKNKNDKTLKIIIIVAIVIIIIGSLLIFASVPGRIRNIPSI